MRSRKAGVAGNEKSNVIFILFSLIIACGMPAAIFAQAESQILNEPPVDVAPPPLRVISPDERKTLDNESGLKKRTQISLEMMEARLINAEKYTSQDNFTQTLNNLGGFQALMENTFVYLEKNDADNKADNRFKQLEIFLRKQVPRLETLRRVMPYRYGYYVLKLMKVVRDTRAKAVEPLFAESVVKSKP